MVDLIHRVWPAASQWQMLVATFGLYIVQIVVFGIWYYFLYRAKPKRFLIASEIVARQAINVSAQTERSISALTREIEAMDEVRTALASGAIVGFEATLPMSFRCIERSGRSILSGSHSTSLTYRTVNSSRFRSRAYRGTERRIRGHMLNSRSTIRKSFGEYSVRAIDSAVSRVSARNLKTTQETYTR